MLPWHATCRVCPMNRFPILSWWLLPVLLSGTAVSAAQTAPSTPLPQIQETARHAVQALSGPGVEVSVNALDPRLKLPACAEPLQAQAAVARGASTSVAVRCEAPTPWTVHVAVRVRELRKVPVLTQAVMPNEIAEPRHFMLQLRDIASLPQGHLESIDTAVGQRFRRSLPANAVPAPGDLSPPRWVRRGDAVQLVSRAGPIEVRAEGRALGDGLAGGRVRVENLRSQRVVEGVVSAPGLVEVRL